MRILFGVISCLGILVSSVAFADDWQALPDDEATKFLSVAESSLAAYSASANKGWCRAKITNKHEDEFQFSFWWQDDQCGLEIENVQLGPNSNPDFGENKRRLSIFTPREQWYYFPELMQCDGFSGQSARRVPHDYDLEPQRFFLAMFDGQRAAFSHLNRLRESKRSVLRVSRSSKGLIRFDDTMMRLVFDPSSGFLPIQAEFQTKLEEVKRPEVMLPVQETYELRQNSQGFWFCRQRTRRVWPRGGGGEPITEKSAVIQEYDSQPSKERLRLTYDSLKLPIGTSVTSTVAGRLGSWIVGREKEGQSAISEARFRELGRLMKGRGFAIEDSK